MQTRTTEQVFVCRRQLLRWQLCAGTLGTILALSPRAEAGSYLNRAVLLVGEARREIQYLRVRLSDKELAAVVQKLAAGRLRAAREMLVPKEVAQAHPHLLLMLENFERAAAAAVAREATRFLQLERRGLDEEQVFRGILEQLGWPLPAGKRR